MIERERDCNKRKMIIMQASDVDVRYDGFTITWVWLAHSTLMDFKNALWWKLLRASAAAAAAQKPFNGKIKIERRKCSCMIGSFEVEWLQGKRLKQARIDFLLLIAINYSWNSSKRSRSLRKVRGRKKRFTRGNKIKFQQKIVPPPYLPHLDSVRLLQSAMSGIVYFECWQIDLFDIGP